MKKFDNLDTSVQLALNAADCKANERFEGPEKDLDYTNIQVSRFNCHISTRIEMVNCC